MRVVHVCCTDSFAGVERHVADLATAQAAAGHEVTVVGGNEERMRGALGADVLVLPGRRAVDAARHLRAAPAIDIVHAHMTAAELAAVIAAPRGARTVSTRHFAAPRGARGWTRPITRWAARRVAAEIAVSRYVAAEVETPTIVIHSGVPRRPDRLPSSRRRQTVFLAQRLEPEKKTDIALHAFAASGACASGWRLEIAGDGSLRTELERHARRLGIGDHTTFLGSRSDIHERMDTCGLFLAPRADEAYGLSVLEAMAAGAPVVAAGGGGHLETVGSVPGAALFEPGNAMDAAEHMQRLMADVALRDVYGEALQQCQRARFTLERQAVETDSVYQSVL